MRTKGITLMCLMALAALVIFSEVTARDLAEDVVETNGFHGHGHDHDHGHGHDGGSHGADAIVESNMSWGRDHHRGGGDSHGHGGGHHGEEGVKGTMGWGGGGGGNHHDGGGGGGGWHGGCKHGCCGHGHHSCKCCSYVGQKADESMPHN